MKRSLARGGFVLAVTAASVIASACAPAAAPGSATTSSQPSGPTPATTVAPAPTGDFADSFDIGGYRLYLSCQGTGSPTVILEAGLAGSPSVWSSVQDKLGKTTRTCSYARAGIAPSDGRPRGTFTKEGVSTGFMVDETWKLLQAAGVSGPYVMVGHSYGGMLVRLFAFRHPDQVAGVVLVDSSSVHQYEGAWLANDDAWADGSTLVDRVASATELKAVTSLGSTPLVVLTQSELSGDFEVDWSHFQDELAALSSNSLHMIAYPSGHMIMNDQEALLIDSIKAVVESSATHGALLGCSPRFSALHALCLKSTMTAQLDAWTAERAALSPAAATSRP